MRTHTPTNGGKRAADSAWKSQSEICSPQVPILYLSCRIYGCICPHHDHEASWDLVAVGTLKIRFRLWYRPTSWFWPPYATRHLPPTTRHSLPASWCLAPATQQVSGSSTQEHTWEHIVKWDWECLASWECTWERRAKQARSVPSIAIRSVLQSMLGRVLENVLGGVLGSVLGVQLGVYLRACSGVWLRASWELGWECTVMQAGCVPSSASGSVLGSMLGSELENILGGVLGSILGVYLGVSWELNWERFESLIGSVSQAGWECTIECNQECTTERTWECAMKCIWQFYWM